MDRVLLKYIFDELCTSFSKKEINGSIKKNADQNKIEINYCITLQELFDNLEKNKNVCMDVYMKREVLQTIYYCKDISIMAEDEKKKTGEKNGSDGNEDYNSFPYDKYNNGFNANIHKNGQDTIINTANKYNLYINNIYIYNKHNLFYYERIKECKEKIFILLYVISTKYNGSIQSSLSKHLNIDVKMIHYHLKVLIQYSLIKKINININGTETNTNNDGCTMSNSANGAMIKLSPSYILYYNIYFIYNMLPIFVKNILFSQNVLSINKIIMYLINKFIIIPQKILSLIFFKLLIVYNPYYFMRIRKALKIFNSILSNLINSNQIIMCKIKIQSNYEICYLNYKNKEKISYDRIINFLLSFYYNYDYAINFIDKSCYLMCEDYVNNEIPIKSSFMNNYSIHKKYKQNLTQQLSMYMEPTGQGHINTEMLQNEIEYNQHREIGSINSNKPELNKQVNISINEFKNHVHLNMDDKFIDSDLYSSSQNDNSAYSLSDFSPVLENNQIETTLEKKTNFNGKYTHERNSQVSYSESPTHSSIDSDNGSDNISQRGNSRSIRSSNLSLYDEMKYIIISKGISGITAKEISQTILLSIKKTNTFLNKLVKNKEVVKIPERKDKSFMYRFVDNNIYEYIQNKKKYYTNIEKETETIVSYDNKNKNINECNVNVKKKKNLQNNEESLISFKANSNQQYSNEIMAEYSAKIKTEQQNNSITNQNIFHYIKINNLNESLNILNYTNTINKIDKNILEYVIPKYDDSINNFSNYKEFFNNYVNKIKQFECKYDLFTCSFHLFYYVKNILQKKQTSKNNNDNTYLYTHTDNNIGGEENVHQFNESNISEHFEEFNININNLDVSKTSIDFIKHFMEDTTKLKSNLFIKRLFIFTHFLLCSKVTTFRCVQDLFTILENNGKLIDRKSVERLFNYSTKINAFFKKCMLQNSKNVKYYFYDSNILTEKQSIELHSKIQQEYAHYFYKQSPSIKHNDKLQTNCSINLQNRTNYTNLDSKNKNISNNVNPNCEIIADNASISQISPSSYPNNYNTSLKLGENYCFQNIDASNAYNVSPRIYNTNVLLNSYSITNISLNDKNNNNKRSINNTENDNPSIIFDHNKKHLHIDSLLSNDNPSVDTTNFYTKKRKTEQDQQINIKNIYYKNNITENIPDSSNNKNNVLYIDVFNESAFACNENKFITPENKKKHTFKNFKMLQQSSNISYFYGYIFSKMERYKYFHKCLIRIMKRKMKRKRNNRILKQYNSNPIFSKTQHEHDGVATCQNKMKKRKISFTLANLKGKNKKKRNKQSNANSLKIKDILKNMYLDEYLKIISVRCKLNYIENYLLKKKKKKIKLKELPPMLFEYLTSYSQLHSDKNNLIKNFILNKSQNMYIHENKPLQSYYDHDSIQIEDTKTNRLSSYSNQREENELKKKKDTAFSPLTQTDQLCQHDIDVIKNNDKISIYIFLYRKLKFLYNMKSIDLRFGNDQENINSTIVNIDDDNTTHTLTCNTKKSHFNNSRNTDLNISIVDLKKKKFNIYIKKYVTINLFSSIKPKKNNQKKFYNMMRYNHFEEYYYSIYLLIEQFKKHFLENIPDESSRKKVKLSDIPKFLKIKNKNLKFLLSHNSYTNQLLLTRKIRKLFINLIKKVKRKETRKKTNIQKHKLMEELIIYKEYNILYNIYNISKTNIEKYFFIFYDLYNNILTKNNYNFPNILEKDDNNNNTALSYSCPFCKDAYFFKSDLLTHISNVHNTNKKCSDIISLMSNTKHTMHKTLSDILKIKNIISNSSPAYGQTMRIYRDNNTNPVDEQVDQASLSFSSNCITKRNELLFHNNTSSDKFSQNTKETKKYEQPLQYEHNNAPDVLQVQNTELKKKTNKQIYIIDQLNTNKIFSRSTHSSVKIKYSLRTVYLYFVTIFIQLYISRINLEKCTNHKKNIGDNKGENEQKALSHQKLCKNSKKLLPKRKRNNLNSLLNKIKLISNKLNTFRLIYYLKNKTNSIPYKKSVWNKANKVMIGKFKYAVCKYIQNKLFYYFKKNIVNYFFILLNENLTRCILNYFPTYIYNCTYTNINYYFDKCIKNIYDFNFISLINLMKLFIINYGSNFILYKEIIKPLFYQKLRNIQNGIKYLKKNMYVVDTSYVLSNYIANDLVCDNIYSNLIYKSIFYKKKLSLFTKKKSFDNVIDIIYSFGSCYFSKILEYAHSENYQNQSLTLNCQIDQLLLHIDNVYNQEQNINYIPNNHPNYISPNFHLDDYIESTNLNKTSNYNQLNSFYEEEVNHINTTNPKNFTYKYNDDNFSNDHQTNAFNIFSDENFDANESTCNESKKYYFSKKLTIFDLNFYVHKFLKGDITLYACNKYTISDDIHSDENKNLSTKFNNQNKYYTPDIDAKQNEDVNNTKYSRGFLKNNNNKDKNKFEIDENSLSFNSSNDDNLDTFDQLSDDYEIIKLLENDNYNNEKLLGGINKHIKHLTKHVSEYFPNYYILNDLKKKILKRLSNIFSDNNNDFISYNFQNKICHNFYYDPNYINNNFFNYFKKYCIYIYQNYNNPIRSKKWKDFKNYTLLNTSTTNNFNFSDLFNKFIEKNEFPNSIVYNKNKLLIYNISKKTFIDFDIYPQNIHLYNIAYISNIQKNIESFLDIQVLNLKNGIFWLQSEKNTPKKKITNLYSQAINNNSTNANKLGINKKNVLQKHNCSVSNKSEKEIKDSQVLKSNRRKYIAKYKSFIRETQIKKFVKKVTIRNVNNSDNTENNKSGISNDNVHKESFIFVVQLMYHVFCMDNIQNNYDEYGNYKAHIYEKNKEIKNVGYKINNMYKYKTTNNATIENINKNNCISNNVYQTNNNLYESNIVNNHDISHISDNANSPNNDTKEKEDNLFNQIMSKMLYVFFIVKQKKKKGCFIDSLKKKYIKKFINKACYNEYFNVKKEYNFILFLLNKLNLIKIFPFINTHKVFLAQYYNGINMCKRKTLFYEHNFKHPFLNMINYYLKNFKVKTQRYSDDEKKIFKKFIKKNRILNQMDIQHDNNNIPHEIGTAKNISNSSNVTNMNYENSSKNNITDENALANRYAYKNITQEKIIYKKKYINYSDYVYINFINNNTLKKPNFIPRLILLFNLQCHIIIHDYFFMYLCENYEQIQKIEKSINDNCNDNTNILYNTRIGNKILNYMGNKKYPTVIKYIKRIINNACKYFEYNLLLHINNNKGNDLQKQNNNNKSNIIYYFKDKYVIANSFIYLNGSVNIKFMFFYILKIFFYIKNNPYSSIFDICKTIEILNLCDLNTLLRAMCDDGFISFKLMFVNKRSEIYKLKKNYQIINDFNDIMRNASIKKKKSQIKKKRKATACYFFDTTSEDEISTDIDTFKTINKSKKDNLKNYNLFIDRILYKKVKLYYIQDENIIFKKYEGTLWN
ncbi:conserved Plasmodium protein, unknown function [Plasmodium chabaudi adami]|uniref:C2H2-type domain-containing protein n=1 Tax=Plasmodium chabaudi adami TaxID=5826 RepID=A0A1D3LJW7_PLACE|nr:conserved Plasmodium protein, unknown function [Plasmodium chabaudi adami]